MQLDGREAFGKNMLGMLFEIKKHKRISYLLILTSFQCTKLIFFFPQLLFFFFPSLPFSSSLLFCVFKFIHTVSLHNFKAQRALTTGYLFFFFFLFFLRLGLPSFNLLVRLLFFSFQIRKAPTRMLRSSRTFYTR